MNTDGIASHAVSPFDAFILIHPSRATLASNPQHRKNGVD